MHNTIEELDELEETLSLCDLPLYSDQSADWDQHFSLATNSQEDYFEFFSQELNPSSTTTTTAAAFPPPENIIFCGKLIPYKQPATTCELDIKIQTINKRRHHWQLFRWKVPKRQEEVLSKKMYNTNKLGKGQGKMSMFTASPSGRKGKWYFLMFGISIFSPAVELGDIKSRQRSLRRQCPPPSPPPMFGSPNHDDKVINDDRGWGLWGLIIRVLSCGGNQLSRVEMVSHKTDSYRYHYQ